MPVMLARALVFGSSAAVLVIEILAGRLMAPYVGVSLETFTGIIGIVLAGIAIGAWAGGWAADRHEAGALLGPALTLSGVLAMAAPFVLAQLGPRLPGTGAAQIVALATSAFFLPSLTLSTIPPMVVKLRLRALEETGRVVGSLSALSTIGALAGTFITGFVLIAAVPSRPLVLGIGALLVLAGIALSARLMTKSLVALAVLTTLFTTVTLGRVASPCDYETTYFCAAPDAIRGQPDARVGEVDVMWAGADAAAFAGNAMILTDDFAPVDQLLSTP